MPMKAQRVVAPVTGAESWTVVDAGYFPVDPAERYLAYLAAIERSPNTVRAYAQSLALWCEFLELRHQEPVRPSRHQHRRKDNKLLIKEAQASSDSRHQRAGAGSGRAPGVDGQGQGALR